MIKSIWEKIKLKFERKPAGEVLKPEQVVEPTKEIVVKVRKPRIKKEKTDANNT